MNKVLISLSVVVIALGSVMILRYQQISPATQPFNPLPQLLKSEANGFNAVKPGWQYVFPDDYGAHPNFQMDAWYFSGYLTSTQNQLFGFQMTFFRFALAPEKAARDSVWASNEIYRAHVAITDVGRKQFHVSERFGRAKLGAGASQSPLQVWLDDWEIRMPDENQSRFQIRATTKEINLILDLESVKEEVTNVDTGAGMPPFHGYWLPRLRASGRVELGSETITVKGIATLSQVWGGLSLYRGQIALNRFVLQLDDKREILIFQLRRRDGSADPINTGLLIAPDGAVRRLSRQELTMSVLEHWQSSKGDVRYPARWRLQIPEEDIQLDIVPMLRNQELNLSVRYWNGLVKVTGISAGQVVSGAGQVELTAYAPDPSL